MNDESANSTAAHIFDQPWIPEVREDGVYLVGVDGSTIARLCRPDHGSDLLVAGYLVGLQATRVVGKLREGKP